MKFRIALIGFLLVIVSIIVTLNYYFDRNYQAEMAEQINTQQLILAKTLSQSIENTLDHFMEEIVSLSRLLSKRGLDPDGLAVFVKTAFEELNEEIKVDILLVGSDGRIAFTSVMDYAFSDEDKGLCSRCRDLKGGEFIILPSTEDRSKIKALTPIIRNNEFVGAILILINIEDLNKKFIMPVRTGTKGNAWIMDSMGTLLYHPTMPEMVGMNIRNHKGECFECHKSFNAELDILNSKEVGFSSYVAPYGEDKLIAFSRIESVGWIVCLSIPFSEVTKSISNSMRMHSMLVLSIMFSTVFVAFFIIMINRARARAEAKAQYVDKVREYADELENLVDERTGELRSEKEKLDVLVSSIHAGIAIFDLDYRCVWYNSVLDEWMSPEMGGSITLKDFYLNKDHGLEFDNAVVSDRSVQEMVQLDLGNKKGFFQIALSPFRMPDGTSQILMLLQDITDLKAAEEQMIQSDKLAALSRLSAGVAHEIGNPLTSISSYVQILKGMEFDEFTTTALDTIYKHIGRIETILRKMSSFTRGKGEDTGDFHLAELVDSTVELVKYDKRAKGVEIKVDIPDDLPLVRINGNQMVQVIMNLMLNAADSMPDGGTLDIRARKDVGWVELSFADTGSGIDKENIKKIFDPFFTTKKSGTGLGLAVCHSIIRLFSGEILVESEPGKGTKFIVRLPLDEK